MTMAYDVLVVYGALGIWGALGVYGIVRSSYRPFWLFGLGFAVVMNVRYFIDGAPDSIAFFVGIYDVFDNLGLGRDEGAPALASCADNACTVWGDRYTQHPSWGVAFYERFANASTSRNALLYGHIGLNTVSFVILHFQLWKPGTGANAARHRLLGRVGFGAITLGTVFAILLAYEHREVGEYGGAWAMWGFFSMSAFVYGTAVWSVVTARRGAIADHRRWSIWFAGSMWGSFWLFRVMLVVTGPLLRQWESASLLISIWFSAPLGILLAELIRRRFLGGAASKAAQQAEAVPVG